MGRFLNKQWHSITMFNFCLFGKFSMLEVVPFTYFSGIDTRISLFRTLCTKWAVRMLLKSLFAAYTNGIVSHFPSSEKWTFLDLQSTCVPS